MSCVSHSLTGGFYNCILIVMSRCRYVILPFYISTKLTGIKCIARSGAIGFYHFSFVILMGSWINLQLCGKLFLTSTADLDVVSFCHTGRILVICQSQSMPRGRNHFCYSLLAVVADKGSLSIFSTGCRCHRNLSLCHMYRIRGNLILGIAKELLCLCRVPGIVAGIIADFHRLIRLIH